MREFRMIPANEVDLSSVKYKSEKIVAPTLSGTLLKLFVWVVESNLVGPAVLSHLKKQNNLTLILQNTVIPEKPLFFPDYPPQDREKVVKYIDDATSPILRVALALECLPSYDPSQHWGKKSKNNRNSFLYWTIRDYAHAYRCGWTTPSKVAEYLISSLEESENQNPAMKFFISFNADEVRKQATESTQRFQEGKPISILDGIFMPIKDDIDCLPYASKGGTTWIHEVRETRKDAVCVSKLRSCGVIFVGKANMHEMGMGVTGNNPHYGTVRNPHSTAHYTGGSSSGPSAIVASGLCPASLGTDGGGSVRIPSALCGVVGMKPTYGRIDMEGTTCEGGTVEVIGPIAATVEDLLLVYAACSGTSATDFNRLKPMSPCFHSLRSTDAYKLLPSLRLGRYSDWFNDVHSHEIIDNCDKILNLLNRNFGIEIKEVVLPETEEMRFAHLVSIGSETLKAINPFLSQEKLRSLSYDVRVNIALFKTFSAANYVAAQCIRNRIMHYYMEAFKSVDVIITPTTAITAPKIPPSSLNVGESNFETSGLLMSFIIPPNLIGIPAISVPVGYDKNGLPIGLQIIGPPWHEATLLHLASAIEEVAACQKKPTVFYDLLSEL